MSVVIYTDGSCLGNPGPGGWAAIEARDDGDGFKVCGSDHYTTNNIMELTAVIGAFEKIEDGPAVTIVTDSKYVKDGITKWVHNWIKKDWRKADGKPVKNKDLWVKLYNLVQGRNVTWEWVKAHNGDHYNEMVDKLARQSANLVTTNNFE